MEKVVLALSILLLIFQVCTRGSSQRFSGGIHGGFTINDNQYTLRWEVFGPFITFHAVARGTGFVGFGLSPKGTMEGSDLFISGMYENGTIYFMDAHGGNAEKDAVSNYHLLFLRQNDMYTEVHFRRAINTGDCKDDIRIMNEPQYVIWSIGPPMDKLEHHGKENRGSVLVNLLNPPMFHAYYQTGKSEMPGTPGCIEEGKGGAGMEKEAEVIPPQPQMLQKFDPTVY